MPRKDFKKYFSSASPDAIDLLEKMLNLDPDYRPTASIAMEHPYLAQYHDPDDEPTSEPLDLDFEGDLSIDQWRRMIWTQISDFQTGKHHLTVDNHRMDTTGVSS